MIKQLSSALISSWGPTSSAGRFPLALERSVACEQALLFGRVKREHASERRSPEGVVARLTSLTEIGELARRLSRVGRENAPPLKLGKSGLGTRLHGDNDH